MADSLVLKLDSAQKTRLGNLAGRLKGVTEFLSSAVESFKEAGFVEAIGNALPWAGALGEALGETVAPVKFVVAFFAKLTEINDPNQLGLIACTLAYQRSVEQAASAIGIPTEASRSKSELRQRLAELETPEEAIHFHTFSFAGALSHPFIVSADRALESFAEGMGFSDQQRRTLVGEVHQRFVPHLKTLLSHGDSRDRFAPFADILRFQTKEEAAYAALAEHADFQRWQFEERPVFGSEPFALAQVYVDTECGMLTWGEIREKAAEDPTGRRGKIDPFSETYGGRQSLGDSVLGLLRNQHFRDMIVVQGVAGAGKSAFTVWLSAELVRLGLRPLRVRMRDLHLDRELNVSEVLADALRLSEEERSSQPLPKPDDIFLGGAIFREPIQFGSARICPYVLILDGWDEISVSVADGFEIRVGRLLENLRAEFLGRDREVPIRIVLTGRPSPAVTEGATFLLKTTPILTIRPLNPVALRQFADRVGSRIRRPTEASLADNEWNLLLGKIVAGYEESFDTNPGMPRSPETAKNSIDVLSLPLLAYLTLKLLAESRDGIEQALTRPTALFRSMLNLTCRKAGKYEHDDAEDEIGQLHRISGGPLRDLLRRTAAAMSALGQESLSYEELSLRLDLSGDQLDERVERSTTSHVLSQLLVSFFFKGGRRELGCEFVHKSFREYLFAEALIERLKAYGRNTDSVLPERTPYWKEFSEDDPRFELSRDLSRLLAPQWMNADVVLHVDTLLTWEISRAVDRRKSPREGQETEPLDLDGWERTRDALADLWDWWGEGVHLRPQPQRTKRGTFEWDRPYICEVITDWAMPLFSRSGGPPSEPMRTVSLDAHLGDALFRLANRLHYELAVSGGWLSAVTEGCPPPDLWRYSPAGTKSRRYQSSVEREGQRWILFRPSGAGNEYFAQYANRINAAGWRRRHFPAFMDLSGLDFSDASLWGVSFTGVVCRYSRFSGAGLEGIDFEEALLDGSDMLAKSLFGTNFGLASLRFVDFGFSNVTGADFRGADLTGAFFAEEENPQPDSEVRVVGIED